MQKTEHLAWQRYWVKRAKEEMKRRDWLAASDCFRAAAFHQHLLRSLKARSRGQ
jgi:signal recognition particle GTPase